MNPASLFFSMGGRGTVGQDVDESICQSERKMQQNATKCKILPLTIALPETGFFFDDSPKKMICGHFCFFEGVTLAYIAIFG